MNYPTVNSLTITNKTFEDNELMPKYGYVCAAITLALIGFFGFFLNLIVIVLMVKEKLINTPLNIILFNLVCSDFSVSVLGNPFTFMAAVAHRWIWGVTMCYVYGFFMSLLGITSITSLTVLAFERYMIVCHAFSKYSLSNKGSWYTVVCIWIYSAILTVPPLLGWGKYVNESANISCSINWDEQSLNAKTYIIYLFIFGLKVPLVVIIFSYVHIIRTIKKSAIQTGQVTKAENRVAYMVLVMVVAFMFAWTPYSLVALIAQFGDASIISPGMSVIPALIAKSSICYNPIIYVGMNTQLRKSLLDMLHLSIQTSSNELNSETFTTVGTSRCTPILINFPDTKKGKKLKARNDVKIALIQKSGKLGQSHEKYNMRVMTTTHCDDNNDNHKEVSNNNVTSV